MDSMEYHNVEPEKFLEAVLAKNWILQLHTLQQAKAKELYESKRWNRGDFLMALYQMK
jgi:hypothetical protein